jgi:hypothetical protein
MSTIQILVLLTFGAVIYVVLGHVVEQAGRWHRDAKYKRHIEFRKAIVQELIEMGYVIDQDPWGPAYTMPIPWTLDPKAGQITNEWRDPQQQQQSEPTLWDVLDDLDKRRST